MKENGKLNKKILFYCLMKGIIIVLIKVLSFYSRSVSPISVASSAGLYIVL